MSFIAERSSGDIINSDNIVRLIAQDDRVLALLVNGQRVELTKTKSHTDSKSKAMEIAKKLWGNKKVVI